MAERSGFFPFVEGDTNSQYDNDFLAKWVHSLISDGIYNGDFAVTAAGNMTITVPAGQAWYNGYYYHNDSPITFTLSPADGILARKDIVVLRWDINSRKISAQVITGTLASSPTAPAIVRTAEQGDLKLAEIYIGVGATSISQANITDTRLDSSACGIVSQLVKTINTTALYNQIQSDLAGFKNVNEASFTTWFNGLQSTFDAKMSDASAATTSANNAASAANASKSNCDTATSNANTAATNANGKATLANTAAGTANTAATNADGKATTANAAATNANNAATAANTAATNANTAADAANLAATNANDKNTAAKLLTARNISLTGKVTGTPTAFDGHADVSIPVTAVNATSLNGYGTDNGSNSVLLSGRKASTTVGASSTAIGASTASGFFSFSSGSSTAATGVDAATFGHYTNANETDSLVMGSSNKALSSGDRFVIGKGYPGAEANAFRVDIAGGVYALSAFNSSGADYSEFFEWLDGNPNAEDRAGKFVTLDGEKIKYANDGDYIVGIVSGAPAIVGDHPSESWCDRWVMDVYGRIQYHDVDVPDQTETITHEDGTTETIVIQPAHTETRPIENPDYDPTKENDYLNRESRPEWDTVGMIGKLVCIDDGTCEANGFCKPVDGIAAKSDTGYRVMARLDEMHVKVLIK